MLKSSQQNIEFDHRIDRHKDTIVKVSTGNKLIKEF